MLKLAVLGAGSHSQQNHLSSLLHYARSHPGEIELVALCDLDLARAEKMAERFKFARVYTTLEQMLRREFLDGCIAVTPIPVTAEIASTIIQAGVPLLMEKPPGATLEQVRDIVALVERTQARVMVSMNRRFDPALQRAIAWQGTRSLVYLRGTMVRHNRREPQFRFQTAIHAVDTLRAIAGDVREFDVTFTMVDGVLWYIVQLVFTSGARGTLEIMPTAGSVIEQYEWFGADYRIHMRAGESSENKLLAWQDGKLCVDGLDDALTGPDFVNNGSFTETSAFIHTLQTGAPMYPTPAQVLQSVELCHSIAARCAERS